MAVHIFYAIPTPQRTNCTSALSFWRGADDGAPQLEMASKSPSEQRRVPCVPLSNMRSCPPNTGRF